MKCLSRVQPAVCRLATLTAGGSGLCSSKWKNNTMACLSSLQPQGEHNNEAGNSILVLVLVLQGGAVGGHPHLCAGEPNICSKTCEYQSCCKLCALHLINARSGRANRLSEMPPAREIWRQGRHG